MGEIALQPHHAARARPRARIVAATLALAALTACGGGLSGEYEPAGNAFFDKLTFRSGGKVDITWMGSTAEAEYTVDGKRITISRAGDTQVLELGNDGCIDGGGFVGRYCPAGKAETAQAAFSGTYEAEMPYGTLALEFGAENRLRATITDGSGGADAVDGSYEVAGDRIVAHLPGAVPLELTHRGDALEGPVGPGGTTTRFYKR